MSRRLSATVESDEVSHSEGHKDAVDSPENQRSVESEADESSRIGQSDGPVREVAVDARLGVDDRDLRTTAAELDVGGGQSSKHQQDTFEGNEEANKVLGVAEPGAGSDEDLVAFLLDLAKALSCFALNGVEAGGDLLRCILHLTAQLVGSGSGIVRDGVDELVKRLACLDAALLDSSSEIGSASWDGVEGCRRGAEVGRALRVLARRTDRSFGRIGSVRVAVGDNALKSNRKGEATRRLSVML